VARVGVRVTRISNILLFCEWVELKQRLDCHLFTVSALDGAGELLVTN